VSDDIVAGAAMLAIGLAAVLALVGALGLVCVP
jgi:hypothetical protein